MTTPAYVGPPYSHCTPEPGRFHSEDHPRRLTSLFAPGTIQRINLQTPRSQVCDRADATIPKDQESEDVLKKTGNRSGDRVFETSRSSNDEIRSQLPILPTIRPG